MKTVNLKALQASLREVIDSSQEQPVVVTRYGRPVAVISGVDGAELGDVLLARDRAFWEEIERRRKEPRQPLAAFKAELAAEERKGTKRAPKRKR